MYASTDLEGKSGAFLDTSSRHSRGGICGDCFEAGDQTNVEIKY